MKFELIYKNLSVGTTMFSEILKAIRIGEELNVSYWFDLGELDVFGTVISITYNGDFKEIYLD